MQSEEAEGRIGKTLALMGFLVVCAVIWWQCRTDLVAQDAASGGAQYNAAFVPELLATLMALLCLAQLVRIWWLPALPPSPPMAGDEEALPPPERWRGGRALLFALLLIGYTASLSFLGYYIATTLLLAGFAVTLDVRHPVALVCVSLLITLAAGFVFGHFLNVVLPPGFLEIEPW